MHHPTNDTIDGDRFPALMHDFYKEASNEFKRLYLLQDKMNESYESVVNFYGEDHLKIQSDEFFGIFKVFVASWEVWIRIIHKPLFDDDI